MPKKILYTGISPITKSYTNLNHMFLIREQMAAKTYMCVWDSFVFESSIFLSRLGNEDKYAKLADNLKVLEKLLCTLDVDSKSFYFSEAWGRLFRDKELSLLYHKILSKITMEDIRKGFRLRYVPFSSISLSRMNCIIADYLIAAYLPRLFPEVCRSAPTHYLTSEKFRMFHKKICAVLKGAPKPVYVTDLPVIMSPKTGLIPSMEDSGATLRRTVMEYADSQKISPKELNDIAMVLARAGGNGLPKKLSRLSKDELSEQISESLSAYFTAVRKIIAKGSAGTPEVRSLISSCREFKMKVKPLNSIKLKILHFCDGTNTSLDIANRTGIRLATVSTYFSRLRENGLITSGRKPMRTADSLVIDLKNIS
ncbi:MAG: hypothetical protein ABIB71_02145 [Candidatus Woesearchaeota archaeon]